MSGCGCGAGIAERALNARAGQGLHATGLAPPMLGSAAGKAPGTT
jgi:hypothetical protein